MKYVVIFVDISKLIIDHTKDTRNKAILVKLPKVKLEFIRQSFRFAGTKIYNELPIEIRRERDFKTSRHGALVRHALVG